MIKLVMTDLDDTLIAAGNPRVSDRALEGIRACLDAGVHVGPATGRTHGDLGWMFDNQEWAYQTAACVNGMVMHLDGKNICTKELDREGMRKAVEVAKRYEHTCVVLTHEGDQYGIGNEPVFEKEAIARKAGRRFSMLEQLPVWPLVKANVRVYGDDALRDEVKAVLADECPELLFVIPNPNIPLVDVLPAGWGKGAGIKVIADALGIGLDEVAVFGDSENDLDMMNAFPNSVAMANAMPVVSESARWHIGSSADDAVADALFDIASAAREGRMPAFMAGE